MWFYFCWVPWVDSKKKEVIDLDNSEDFVEELEVKKEMYSIGDVKSVIWGWNYKEKEVSTVEGVKFDDEDVVLLDHIETEEGS